VPCNSNGYKRETSLSQTPHTCGLDDMALDILTPCNNGQDMMRKTTFTKRCHENVPQNLAIFVMEMVENCPSWGC